MNQILKKNSLLGLLIFLAFTMSAQDLTVTGTVTDVEGEVLAGASVLVQNSSNGAITDVNGNYTLNNVAQDATIVFSYIGYSITEIQVNGNSIINATLTLDDEALQEIVVVGYGSMERQNVTGAIVTVDVEEANKAPVPNVVESLRGQVPGLQISRGSGQPGSGVSFNIRGFNSLGAGSGSVQGSNQPIIVIDGVPLVGGNMADLNPNDIASINVLKDGASAAIYGASGANGAILITTKSGKGGKPKLTFNASSGVVGLANRINFMNGDEYVKYILDSEIAGGNENPTVDGALRPNEVENYIAGDDVDWQDALIDNGLQNNFGFSASGGAENINYYFSGNYYKEQGIVTHSDYERFSLRFNGSLNVTDWIEVGSRVQFSKSFADETANAIDEFNLDGGFAPFIPISNNTPLGDFYNDEGGYSTFITNDQFQINPLHRYSESVLDRNITRSYISPYLNINFLPDLKYTLNTFIENRSTFFGRFESSDYSDTPSYGQMDETEETTYLIDNILNYSKDFGEHTINATAVYGMQWFDFRRTGQQAEFLPTDLLGYYGVRYALSEDLMTNNGADDWGKVYNIGRIGYTYDDRYSVTGTIRRDGSSRFAENNRWGYFPSAAFAWNIHNEVFMNSFDTFNFLKLRLSYAETGNDNFPTFLYRQGTNSVQTAVGVDPDTEETIFVNGFGPSSLASNPNLKWESSNQMNIGIDFGVLNDKISGSVDVFQTNTTDLLLTELINPVPNNGATEFASNVGETKSRGIELGVKTETLKRNDFTWNTQLNWATNKNEIVRLSRGDEDDDGNPIDNPANGWFIGEDIRVLYDYEFLGVNPEDGSAIIQDQDGDGAITANDRTFLGSPTPEWYGGINNIFNYKGFELSVLFEAVQGVTRVNNYIGGYTGRNNQIAIDYWTPDNTDAAYPSIGSGGDLSGQFANAIKVQDASFVALRNLSVGYNFPSKLFGKTPIEGVSIYVRGNNLKYWTDFTDAYSPESGVGSYPVTRTVIGGINATF